MKPFSFALFPSSSISSKISGAKLLLRPPASFPFFLSFLGPGFLRVAALRLPTTRTVVDPLELLVATPGAGRLRHLLCMGGSVRAGVFRAILVRRGRSIVAVAVTATPSTPDL
ncbi:hypothetical protein Golomagni_00635 [Golovinomyces magnicellulatus]|nr:hypothetical protein Golomagni_00635 [Golovinomyces magnicellulatus]